MLNKQGPGKIDWTSFTWNPVKGVCRHGCDYCYMKRIYERFKLNPKIRFDEKTLKCKFPEEPSKIFVGSSHDIFGDWIPDDWIERIIAVTKEHPQHTFQFLTKNPKRYREFIYPENCWLGMSIDTNKRWVKLCREFLVGREGLTDFVSFEPLLEELDVELNNLDWIIIGANSNPGAPKPPNEWADKLIIQARKLNIPVWVKDNYKYPTRIKEWPKPLALSNESK